MNALRGIIAVMATASLVAWAVPSHGGPFDDGVAAYDRGDFAAALAAWLPLAEHGSTAAQFNVAELYEKGGTIARDDVQAAHWYLLAARGGDVDAALRIAAFFEAGIGVPKSVDDARTWYTAVLSRMQRDRASDAARVIARARLAALDSVTQETFAYDGGRFVLARSADGTCIIGLQGMVTPDAAEKFDMAAARSKALGCASPWLMLESPGGVVSGGLALGREIRDSGFRTVTRYDCASMCAFLFMAGNERVLIGSRARIGLHQVSLVDRDGKFMHCMSPQNSGVRDIRRYMWDMLQDDGDAAFDELMHTPCRAITWEQGQHAMDLKLATRSVGAEVDIFGPLASRRAATATIAMPAAATEGAPAAPAAVPAGPAVAAPQLPAH